MYKTVYIIKSTLYQTKSKNLKLNWKLHLFLVWYLVINQKINGGGHNYESTKYFDYLILNGYWLSMLSKFLETCLAFCKNFNRLRFPDATIVIIIKHFRNTRLCFLIILLFFLFIFRLISINYRIMQLPK